MIPMRIALTTLTREVAHADLTKVAAVLQRQLDHDFSPIWGMTATVEAAPFAKLPPGATPIIVHDGVDIPGSAGFHRTEAEDTPYALVPAGKHWPHAASHACLEMLADPSGSRKVAGPCLLQRHDYAEYLIEPCSPCGDFASSYEIDGLPVSDFCVPNYYSADPAPRYSFTGAIRRPLQVLPRGALAWVAVDRLIYQARADGAGELSVFGGFSAANRDGLSLREFVSYLSPPESRFGSNSFPTVDRMLSMADAIPRAVLHADRFRDDIAWRFGYTALAEAQPWNPEPIAAYARALRDARAGSVVCSR